MSSCASLTLVLVVKLQTARLRETTLIVSAQLETPYALDLFTQLQNAKLEETKARFTSLWIPAVEAIVQQVLLRASPIMVPVSSASVLAY